MDHEMLGLLFRGIERLIIVSAAFVAIWQGFRLFSTIVSDNGSFEGSLGEWKIKLQRIAPGVFFAGFGAIVLLLSVSSPFSYRVIEPEVPKPQTEGPIQTSGSYISGYPSTNERTKAQKLILDLTTVTGFLSLPDMLKQLSTDDQSIVGDAIIRLRQHRLALVDVAYDDGWSHKYTRYFEQFRTTEAAKSALSNEEYEVFQAIHSSLSFETK